MKRKPDLFLLITGGLLLATVMAFLLGLIPYPFGILVLSLLFTGRLLTLLLSRKS